MTDEAMEPPAGYAAAVEELESILREIEGDAVDVDVLAGKVARASVLIEFCRDRIQAAEAAVDDAAASAGTDLEEE